MSTDSWHAAFRSLAVVIVATVAVLAVVALALEIAGADGGRALTALWRGSLGSWDAFTSATLVRATPLMFTGLAVALAFRAGVWNIGAEGQLLVGAAATTAVTLSGASLSIMTLPLALFAGAIAGGVWAGLAAILRRRYAVPEVIGTIMLNFIALYLVGYLVRGPLQEPTGIYPQSAMLPDETRLPRIIPNSRLHLGLVLALLAAPLLHWVLRATASGFRIRVTGASPRAARIAGLIDVDRTTLTAFAVSGVLAGVAGASEVTGVTYALYENLSPGYGYIAIAVALLARLEPLAVITTAILFGALEAGAVAMQRDAGVPASVVSAVEALLILALLGFERWRGTVVLPARLTTR